ncbi:unnamed protein product [Brassicogethes aeneus]|uniref:Uncharacterized protein n=1 Tax=Brassicogethes aeneus TaxID=1431903 RepID=A0A9P0FMG5_BRAAE|nr:unnamed protein product [Brassicogethes aeneus]
MSSNASSDFGEKSFIIVCTMLPCCGHSLNLVGKAAANACTSAVQFFDFVQNLYTFFTFYVLKRLSDTRWSCRAEATKAIVDGYFEIKEAISCDKKQNEIVRIEATHLLEKSYFTLQTGSCRTRR